VPAGAQHNPDEQNGEEHWRCVPADAQHNKGCIVKERKVIDQEDAKKRNDNMNNKTGTGGETGVRDAMLATGMCDETPDGDADTKQVGTRDAMLATGTCDETPDGDADTKQVGTRDAESEQCAEHDRRDPILSVRDMGISFGMYEKGFRRTSLPVIRSLSLDVYAGEILAVIGSSGSGKSLLAHAILGILPRNATMSGEIIYQGKPLTKRIREACRGTEIMLIPQSVDYLDPLMRVGKQVIGTRGSQAKLEDAFKRYDLPAETSRLYPFQLSGGMARRILISTAVMGKPKLIIADEPTPGLSPELAKGTFAHFREMADAGVAVLLITHDVDLALGFSDRIAVLYAGTTMEIAPTKDFAAGKDALRHPYSKAFIDALPQNGFQPIQGSQPYVSDLPEGCLFAERCADRTDECAGATPMRRVRGGEVRCIHAT
jgi:peptide/nickel transport system ATP-binding protein